MLRPWNLGEPVGHLMEQVVPSCLPFWLILWGAWAPGRARRVLEEGASTCRRSSPPSWYEPLSCPSPASLALHSPSARLPICLRLRVLPFFSVDLVLNVLALQGSPNSHPSEELLKQADYSDKIKQMLVPPGFRPGPIASGFLLEGPEGPKGMQHFLREPGKPMPDPHGGLGCPVSPEGPRLLCPPPSSREGVAIPPGMAHVTPCRVTWCRGISIRSWTIP